MTYPGCLPVAEQHCGRMVGAFSLRLRLASRIISSKFPPDSQLILDEENRLIVPRILAEPKMPYAIKDFWGQRLQGLTRPSELPRMSGWTIESAPTASFVEAELKLREGYDDLETPIWFVAAPGAVGKSTLAKAISAYTGAIYLDLAKAETVAGNYLTGGLVKNRLLDAWQANKSTILIDALYEARLRVTQSSFEDFLQDVESLSRGRRLPTVLFGRVGIVDEAWLILADAGLSCPIFDIDFFDRERSMQFIMAVIERLSGEVKYRGLATSLTG
jgi:hypothetical protein